MGCGASKTASDEDILRISTPVRFDLRLVKLVCPGIHHGENVVFLGQLRFQRKKFAMKHPGGTEVTLSSEALLPMQVSGKKVSDLAKSEISLALFVSSANGEDREHGKCKIPIQESWCVAPKGVTLTWPLKATSGNIGQIQVHVKVLFQEDLAQEEDDSACEEEEEGGHAPKPTLLPQQVEECKLMFRTWDHDGSGKLSFDEVFVALSKLGCKDRMINKFLRSADKNQDNMISFEEFKSGYGLISEELVRQRHERHKKKKKKRKQSVSQEEAAVVIKGPLSDPATDKIVSDVGAETESAARMDAVRFTTKAYTVSGEQFKRLVSSMILFHEKTWAIEYLICKVPDCPDLDSLFPFASTPEERAHFVEICRTALRSQGGASASETPINHAGKSKTLITGAETDGKSSKKKAGEDGSGHEGKSKREK